MSKAIKCLKIAKKIICDDVIDYIFSATDKVAKKGVFGKIIAFAVALVAIYILFFMSISVIKIIVMLVLSYCDLSTR